MSTTTEADEMNTCARCGDSYEPYTVLIKDDFNSISEYVETQRDWNLHENGNDGLCKPCRVAVAPSGYFTGASEVEPKEVVEEGVGGNQE